MRLTILFLLMVNSAFGQAALQQKIQGIAADTRGKVSVSCALPGSTVNCDLEPHARPPMQSVFKLPLAVTALHLVEHGNFSLDQPIRFLAADRILPHTHSPLQDKYPNADVDVPLRELLELAVTESDNAAADVVLRVIGGPAIVQTYIRSLGVTGFQLKDGEDVLAQDSKAQYRNWFEPASAVQLLRRLIDDSPLTAQHTQMLLGWMETSPTGPLRIKGELPGGTLVMHKTGSSGTENGVTKATNDIGLITLPDGRRLAIAVFVTDCRSDATICEAVIARIAKAAYEESVRAGK
jgi:beta-lactamase class A